mmetsp:Transcript_67443/g.106746  ORF Transcript_67443/g.106746 Transcript_67443/m.106746 type:complete len:494 (-) Transcript_67443:10-1491(-)
MHMEIHRDKQDRGKDEQSPRKISRLEELDALRGLCTCAVIASHFNFAFGDYVVGPEIGGFMSRLANLACLTFFAMSGHVVAYHYLQTGSLEALVGAAFRRIPRLILPVLWANLLSWQLAVHGGYSSENDWRLLKKSRGFKGEWCKDCMTKELVDVLYSSAQVLWTVRPNHFLWLWTVHCEIIGSFMVFLLAPLSRYISSSRMRLDGTDDLILVHGKLWPQQLIRCISFHVVVLVLLLGLGIVTNHCIDFEGPLAPAPWCDSNFNVVLSVAGVAMDAGAFFLFNIGLASAHIRVLLTDTSCSWARILLSKWNENWLIQGVVSACLILGGLSVAIAPGDDLIFPWLAIRHGRSILFQVGAGAIVLGVVAFPQVVKDGMKRISFLGQMSFSMYLVHMSIIWSIGMPLYVWFSNKMNPNHAFALIACICVPCIYWFSAMFQQAIEEPLGVKLPRYTFDAIKWLLFDARKPKQPPQATQRMSEFLSQADLPETRHGRY